ncbi:MULTISPECIES: OmpA family protein [unclassified Brevundimonas]|uniref:OmpA family protein n=1 Tax=unclassified Brevundimonas TaxID=2622653 RepID=UPI0020045F7D|nr:MULTISPECIES: OmpA family protein [unclassified Brevundimonas]MCK6103270.1 OmpA family protein [Brevundimonas sp. EYE_349]
MKWPLAVLASSSIALSSPAMAHPFLDYFPYGKADLSPKGYETAREVAGYVQRYGPDSYRVVIAAHMDTAEGQAFSDELSARRAQSMATELVRLGLEPARIEIRPYGTRALAKPTDRDVREPLNRRVTVDVNL